MSKKLKTALITVCLLLTVTVVYALAAAGGASDPLASLSYLTGTFTDAVDRQVDAKLDEAQQNGGSGAGGTSSAAWSESRLKEGDLLTGSTGRLILSKRAPFFRLSSTFTSRFCPLSACAPRLFPVSSFRTLCLSGCRSLPTS